jgi:hypothetical protein
MYVESDESNATKRSPTVSDARSSAINATVTFRNNRQATPWVGLPRGLLFPKVQSLRHPRERCIPQSLMSLQKRICKQSLPGGLWRRTPTAIAIMMQRLRDRIQVANLGNILAIKHVSRKRGQELLRLKCRDLLLTFRRFKTFLNL